MSNRRAQAVGRLYCVMGMRRPEPGAWRQLVYGEAVVSGYDAEFDSGITPTRERANDLIRLIDRMARPLVAVPDEEDAARVRRELKGRDWQ